MKTKALLFILFLFCLSLISCKKDEVNNNFDSAQEVIISADLYDSAPRDFLVINSAVVVHNGYLKINFSSSGCSGETWEVKLIDADVILESNPPQRNLRLSLKNNELCEAYLTKELLVDIRKLKVDGNQVILNLSNYSIPILYEF